MLMQPVREEMCPHTTSNFILIWFSCFAVWLKQSLLISFLKAEFGDSKLFWGWLGDPVCLLTQSHKQPRLHHKTAMKLAISHDLWRTRQLQYKMLTGNSRIPCANVNAFSIMPWWEDFCHKKGLWKWDGKVSAFVLQISLNNLKHSSLGSIPGFRKSSSKGCPSAFASTCLMPWERQLLLKLTKASFDLPPCLHPSIQDQCPYV